MVLKKCKLFGIIMTLVTYFAFFFQSAGRATQRVAPAHEHPYESGDSSPPEPGTPPTGDYL